MPVYLCRWPNGDLTVAGAPNKQGAVVLLDEFGNADYADIFQVPEFLADFKLTDRGEFELSRFGEAADDRIMEKAYPLLWKAMLSDEVAELDEHGKEYRKVVRAAVQEERTRLQRVKKNLPQAKTPLGRRLQKEHDLPVVEADRLVNELIKAKDRDK